MASLRNICERLELLAEAGATRSELMAVVDSYTRRTVNEASRDELRLFCWALVEGVGNRRDEHANGNWEYGRS
jgi:hypothetical protein